MSHNNKDNPQQHIMDYKNFTIEKFDIIFGKNILLQDAKLIIEYKQHYGLIGKNGIGKTSLLNMINEKRNGVPQSLDIVYVKQEENDIDRTVMDTILSADNDIYTKTIKFDKLTELINNDSGNITDDILQEYNKLCTEIGTSKEKNIARTHKILMGLGFSKKDHSKKYLNFLEDGECESHLQKHSLLCPRY